VCEVSEASELKNSQLKDREFFQTQKIG